MKALLVSVVVIAAYLLGSIPFGLLAARARGVDLRAHGSGNIGATNVWRVMGRGWGLFTFFADAAKGWLAVFLAMWLAQNWTIHVALPHGHEQLVHFPADYAGIAGALGAVLGHNFPVWLNFKGGKGVATSLGVIVGMMPLASLIVFAIWGVVFKVTRYVSLASIVAAMCLPVVVIVLYIFNGLHGWACFFFSVAAALMVVIRHRPNISRLLAGVELRAGEQKPSPPTPAPEDVPGAPSSAVEIAASPAPAAPVASPLETQMPPPTGPGPAAGWPPPSKAPPDLPAP